ncbi:MAG: VWA domain-containing protein [Planctomycetota bacterium]
MTGMQFYNLNRLLLLWAIPLLLAVYAYAAYRRRQALEIFAEANLLRYINVSVSAAARRWKAVLVVAALAFIVLGLARPAWNPKPKTLHRTGRDVVFVLDVSKSMLAEDLAPSRLGRAKLAILDCVERLQGDRVGLVVFAGNAVVKCPLTLDYGFFRMAVEDISPESVSRGGTQIGDAIRKCLTDVFDERDKEFKDIILITDGEDHDSFPVEAAKKAGEQGIRILAIGIGDEDQGRRIPITDENGEKTFLKYKGQEVWSKLDADVLRKMVNATPGGKYLNVATGTIDLGNVYMELVASAEKKELEAKTVERYEEKFQIFLGVALALLCLEMVLNDRKRNQSNGA